MDIESLYKIFLEHPIVTTDSRDCPKGSIFFALKGGSFDGNKFADTALEKGCAYCVIDNPEYAKDDERYILVEDCLKTLQNLATYHRESLGLPIVGITGTNGKTTTKELVSTVLSKKYNTLYTQGNFNNHIGVPKTLLRLTKEHEMAVIEMGANHPGEISQLTSIARPDFGLITNVGKAHLEGFGSFEGVIHTKGEMYDYLRNSGKDATVFIHRDNKYLLGIVHGLKIFSYGSPVEGCNQVSGRVIECAPYLSYEWRVGQGQWMRVDTKMIGTYNLDNFLAASAVGVFFGVEVSDINDALSSYIPHNNRSQLTKTEHNHLIIDAYNANPTSMGAALKNFRETKVPNKFAILGDMRELGAGSHDEHQKIVNYIKDCGFEKVWLVGDEFAACTHEYRTFKDVEEVKEAIGKEKPEGYYILIKGSNGIHLSEILGLL